MAQTVLIVDDHAGFRSLARRMLEAAGFQVAEADTGEAALRSLGTLHPDLVLLDIQLPGVDGIEVARRFAAGGSGTVVVLTSARDPADFGPRLTTAPAAAFVPKAELSAGRLRELLVS